MKKMNENSSLTEFNNGWACRGVAVAEVGPHCSPSLAPVKHAALGP